MQRFLIVSFFVLSVSNFQDIDISSIHILVEVSFRSFFRRNVSAVNTVSQERSVGMLTWLRAGRPRNRGSVRSRTRDFPFSTASRPALSLAQSRIDRAPQLLPVDKLTEA